MLMRERRELAVIGDYRRHPEPMQVVSGPDYDRRIHYEAPPSHRMMAEMDRFVAWYGRIASTQNRLSALTWAGIAHLFFVWIHPFEDGNGRIGRALAEKALAQSLGEPSLIALSRIIARRRKAYYNALEAANRSLDVSDWLVWFAGTVLEAQLWSERPAHPVDRAGQAVRPTSRPIELAPGEGAPAALSSRAGGFRGGDSVHETING